MTRFVADTTLRRKAEELKALIAAESPFPLAPKEKTQYTELHRQLKRKGGSAPRDYILVEVLADLDIALNQGDFLQVAVLLSQARRLINGV